MKPKSLALYIIDTNDSILPERRAEAIDFVNAQSDELATLRAQLAEARELIAEAKVEIGFTLTGLTQPSNSAYNKLSNYLKKVTTA